MPDIPLPPRSFVIPPLHLICPWKASMNPYHEQVSATSRRWILSYDVLPPSKHETLENTDSELLASWMWPYAAPDRLRLCCDLMIILFVLDEITDDQSSHDAADTCSIFLRALGDEQHEGATEFCRMLKDFRSRCLPVAREVSYARLLRYLEHYTEGVKVEAELRERNVVLDEEAYYPLRRRTIGVLPTCAMLDWCLEIDLPDYVFDDPVLNAIMEEAMDLTFIPNDVYSYKKEQTRNQYASNILTVLQKQRGLTLQEATDHATAQFKTLVEKFEMHKKCIPSFGEETDTHVQQYVSAIQCMVSGNIAWSLESRRYFGDRAAEIKNTGVVELSPFVPQE